LGQNGENHRLRGIESAADDKPSGGKRRIGKVVNTDERRLEGARFLRHAGAHPVPGVALDTGALLLAVNPIGRLRAGNGESEGRRQTENNGTQSQISKWARRFIHSSIICALMNV
jgi:hypothetical protein